MGFRLRPAPRPLLPSPPERLHPTGPSPGAGRQAGQKRQGRCLCAQRPVRGLENQARLQCIPAACSHAQHLVGQMCIEHLLCAGRWHWPAFLSSHHHFSPFSLAPEWWFCFGLLTQLLFILQNPLPVTPSRSLRTLSVCTDCGSRCLVQSPALPWTSHCPPLSCLSKPYLLHLPNGESRSAHTGLLAGLSAQCVGRAQFATHAARAGRRVVALHPASCGLLLPLCPRLPGAGVVQEELPSRDGAWAWPWCQHSPWPPVLTVP